jgi:hypothetical protein
MYATFLELALNKTAPSDRTPTTGEALTKLHQCRSRLAASSGWHGTPEALADELNYDVALVSLAHLLGINVDVQAFARPLIERSRLEEAIVATGFEMHPIEGPFPHPAGA